MTMEALHDQLKDSAEKAVKGQLVLEAIANAEKVQVTDEDVEAEFKKMADMYGMEVEKVKELMGANTDALKVDLKSQKTVQVIVDAATIGKPAAKKTAAKKVADTEEKPAAKKATAAKKTTTTAAKKTTTAKKSAEGEEKPAAKKTTAKKTATTAEKKTTTAKKTTAKKDAE